MKSIATKIQNKIYTYEIGQFMPVFENGQLLNRNEFIRYKAISIIENIVHK